MTAGKGNRFLGIGIDNYQDTGLAKLEHPITDVQSIFERLTRNFAGSAEGDLTAQQARERLADLVDSVNGGALVTMWSGHGLLTAAGGMRLLATDSKPNRVDGLNSTELMAHCAISGASQILLVVDCCHSGAAGLSAIEIANALLAERPPEAEQIWVGVLAACSAAETARDGLLAAVLRKLLDDGPTTPDLVRRWSFHNRLIRGDDLCDAVLKEWPGTAYRPEYASSGSPWWMIENPLWDADAPPQVVEHLLLAARSQDGQQRETRSWFTGRVDEVNTLVSWTTNRAPGLFVITGSAGTGKSAVLGRLVSVSVKAERESLGEPTKWEHDDPGLGSVTAHAHARGLTADRLADVIGEQLIARGVFPRWHKDPLNADELLGAIRKASDEGGFQPPVIAIDGLDEARGESFTIARDLLLRLAQWAMVIVSTRELPGDDSSSSLVGILTTPGELLNLDSPEAQTRGRDDMRRYLIDRLTGVAAEMSATAVADHFLAGRSMVTDQPFLVARLMTAQLRATPVDTSTPQWESRVSTSIEMAFEADIGRADASGVARHMLTALTWAYGAGFPEDEWLAVGGALAGQPFDRDQISWMLAELGRYVVQDGEAGVAVYRLAHQSLADHLRPAYRPTRAEPFDSQATPISETLLTRYGQLLHSGMAADAPGYL
jgi:hypothetical protein